MRQEMAATVAQQYKTLRRLYLVYLAAAAVALVLVFFQQFLTLAILALSLVYHFAYLRPRSRAYTRAYIHTCVQLTLEQHLRDAVHSGVPTLTEEEVRRARLIPDNGAKGSILLREGACGTFKGAEVRLGDATLAHSFPMEGKTHHEFVTGCWVTVALSADTGLHCRLLPRRAMLPASREKFCREHPELRLLRDGPPVLDGEAWVAFVTDNAPGLPGEDFLRWLKKLADSTAGLPAVCVEGDRLHVFLINRILGRKVSIREEPSEAAVSADALPELKQILHLSELL